MYDAQMDFLSHSASLPFYHTFYMRCVLNENRLSASLPIRYTSLFLIPHCVLSQIRSCFYPSHSIRAIYSPIIPFSKTHAFTENK